MNFKELILAIDQSTSATKAMLFTTSGELLDKESVSHEQIYPQPGWVEHDVEEIYANLVRAVSSLLTRNRAAEKLLFLSIRECQIKCVNGVSLRTERTSHDTQIQRTERRIPKAPARP